MGTATTRDINEFVFDLEDFEFEETTEVDSNDLESFEIEKSVNLNTN